MSPVRDPTKTHEVYSLLLQEKLHDATDKEKYNAMPGRGDLYFAIQSNYHEIADIMYSRGDDVAEVAAMVKKVLELQLPLAAYERSQGASPYANSPKTPGSTYMMFEKGWSDTFENFYDVLLIVSKSVLLNIDTYLLRQYLSVTIAPGFDVLLDSIINYRLKDWPVAKKGSYPKKFDDLYMALKAETAEERAACIGNYVKSFLTKMKGHPQFGKHMLRDENYTGYWCYVAPAVALVTHTETDSVKNMKYYPTDYLLR